MQYTARPPFSQKMILDSTNQTVLCFDNLEQIRSLQKLDARTRTEFAKQSVDLQKFIGRVTQLGK